MLLSLVGESEEQEESSAGHNSQRLGAVCIELHGGAVHPLQFGELIDALEAPVSVLPRNPMNLLHKRYTLDNDEELDRNAKEDVAGSKSHEAEVAAAVEVA